MNIQKSELMILDKIRFRAGENAPQAPVPAPVETEQSAEKGMKALSFMGAQNLVSNPGLAHNIRKYGLAALMAITTAGATGFLASCSPEPTKVEQKTEVNVTVDQEQVAMLQAILEELKAMGVDIKAIKEYNAEYKDNFNKIISMVSDLYAISQQEAIDNEKFRKKVLENQSSIIFLAEQQGIKSDKANKMLEAILNSNMSVEAKLEAIKGLVTDIKSMFSKALDYAEKAQQDRAKLLEYAKKTYVNTNVLKEQGEQYLINDSIKIANQEQIISKLDLIDLDMNAGFAQVVEKLGVEGDEVRALLKKLGYTDNKIETMNAAAIINAIKEGTKVNKEQHEKTREAINLIDIDVNAAKEEIVKILNSIDGNVAELLNQFKKYASNQKKFDFMVLQYASQVAKNTKNTANNTKITNTLLEKLNESIDSLNINVDVTGLAEAIKEADENNQADNEKLLAELQKQTKLQNQIAEELKALKKQHEQGLLNDKQYADAIIDAINGAKQVLDSINNDLGALSLAFVDFNNTYNANVGRYDDALEAIKTNTYHSAYYNNKLYEAYAAETAGRNGMYDALEKLLPLVQNIDGTTTSIYNKLKDLGLSKDDLEALFNALNLNQEARKDEIVKAIKDAKDDIKPLIDDLEPTTNAILEKLKEIENKIGSGSPERVDLTKIEKELADILAAIGNIKPCDCPDYSALLKEIRDKIQPCNCNCGELKVVVEEIKTIIEQRNSDEGIRNPGSGFIN